MVILFGDGRRPAKWSFQEQSPHKFTIYVESTKYFHYHTDYMCRPGGDHGDNRKAHGQR